LTINIGFAVKVLLLYHCIDIQYDTSNASSVCINKSKNRYVNLFL